jgi:hypothetical protein
MSSERSWEWSSEVERWVRERPGKEPAAYLAQMTIVRQCGHAVEHWRAPIITRDGNSNELRMLRVVVAHLPVVGISYFIDSAEKIWFLTVTPPGRAEDAAELQRAKAAWLVHPARST